jgi:hypothetical protein
MIITNTIDAEQECKRRAPERRKVRISIGLEPARWIDSRSWQQLRSMFDK